MIFDRIEGNRDVCNALVGMVDSGKVPHAILFHEDDGSDGFMVGLAFLEYLFDGNPRVGKLIHPDIHFVFPTVAGSLSRQYMEQFRKLMLENPHFTERELNEAFGIEGKNSVIAVGEAKQLLESLSLSALEGGYRAVFVYLPEKMNQEAASRLLKLIEEPPLKTQFVFISHYPEKVLQTILSRCQRIRIVPSRESSVCRFDDPSILDDLMGALVSGNLSEALEVSDRICALSSREEVKSFCKFAAERMRQVFLRQQGLTALCREESEVLDTWAAGCRKSFPRQALEAFGRMQSLIDRNVSTKILVTDLVDRLFLSI